MKYYNLIIQKNIWAFVTWHIFGIHFRTIRKSLNNRAYSNNYVVNCIRPALYVANGWLTDSSESTLQFRTLFGVSLLCARAINISVTTPPNNGTQTHTHTMQKPVQKLANNNAMRWCRARDKWRHMPFVVAAAAADAASAASAGGELERPQCMQCFIAGARVRRVRRVL